MTEFAVDKLEWDDWNIEHIAKHNVAPEEAVAALLDPGSKRKAVHSGRFMIIGRSGPRILSVILGDINASGKYYVVTARDSDKRERADYRKS